MKYSSLIRARAGQAHTVKGTSRHDHQRRDVAIVVVEQRVHLQRAIEVVLAVENGDSDVVPGVQQLLEVVCSLDLDRLVSGLGKLSADSGKLSLRKSNGDGGTRHVTETPYWRRVVE